MRLNLSSQIVLNKVPVDIYQPKTAVDRSELTRYEKIVTDIFPKTEDGASHIADQVEAEIKARQREGKYCVLGLGTGLSLTPVYTELIRRYENRTLSFSNVVVFNAYEYFPITDTTKNSSIRQLKERLLDHVDIPAQNIFSFDGTIEQDKVQEACRLYEQRIESFGGIDVMLLGIGRVGNIATNEPGSGLSSTSRIILVNQLSREEMTMSFGTNEPVPPCSITLGISNILKSRKIFLVAWGEEKADIIRETVEGRLTDAIPASFLQTHNNAHVVCDLSAASKLTRIIHPWLVKSCTWNDKLVRSALVWLCLKIGKPILKLTNKDYNENGLTELLALYGSAYNANIKIFNDLQHTITGWPGGKPNADDTYRPERETPYPKRVLIFSPHPDDVAVSMGGTVRRLVQQGHDVSIAFQTDGDVAVSDDDMMCTILLADRLSKHFEGQSFKFIEDMLAKIIGGTTTADDNDNLRYFKGSILLSEAMMACRQMGVPRKNLHDLRMPFYVNDPHGQGKITEADVQVTQDLISQIKPHQIFFDNDLVDPNGTHVRATSAVMHALENLKGEDFMRDCRVWMYRGQWGQWDVDQVEMAVPMSPEEFGDKRDAILKFHSQIHDAPFRSSADGKLSWQRSIDRNRDLAEKYQQLGLATYEAIEAFVQYRFHS